MGVALASAGPRLGSQLPVEAGHSDRQVWLVGRLLGAITRVSFYFQDEEDVAQMACEERGVISHTEMTKVYMCPYMLPVNWVPRREW